MLPDFGERFEIKRLLGSGGMGEVYEAYDRKEKRLVALKTGDDLEQLKKEYAARQEIYHRNFVRIYEFFENRRIYYFAMELVDGPDLLAHLRPHEHARMEEMGRAETFRPGVGPPPQPPPPNGNGPFVPGGFDEPLLRDAFAQVAQGLSALHAKGWIHRDIKPSNIRVAEDGRVVILDFGLTVSRDALAPPAGTLDYMPPEVFAGQADVASDWYSFGVTLYEVLTGRRPFPNHESKRHPPARPSALDPSVPKDLDDLCVDLLAPDPAERPSGQLVARVLPPDWPSYPLVPLPPAFVDRIDELARIRRAFEVAQGGQGVSVFIEAESGFGKSTLLAEFLHRLRKDHSSALVLKSRCYERMSVPYKGLDGIIEALSAWLRKNQFREDLAELLQNLDVALLVQAFPALQWVLEKLPASPLAHDSLSQIGRQRVLGTVHQLLARLAKKRPLVLAIDDLQWAEQENLLPLYELCRAPSKAHVLLVATVQLPGAAAKPLPAPHPPIELPPEDEAKGVWRIPLLPLSDDHAIELARAYLNALGRIDADPLAIVKEARGRPLDIEYLVQYLLQSLGGEARPPSFDEVLQRIIQGVDPRAQRVLELIALADRPIRPEVLSKALRVESVTAELVLLSTAKLARSVGSAGSNLVVAYHDRIRVGILATLPEAERRTGHQKLAEALEALASSAPDPALRDGLFADIAFHLDAAVQPERAFRYALAAVETARKRFDMQTAERCAQIAIKGNAAGTRAERLSLFHEVGKVHLFRRQYAEAIECFQRACDEGDSALDRARQQRWLGEVAFQQEDWDRACSEWGRGLALLGQRVPPRATAGNLLPEVLRLGTGFFSPRPPRNPRPAEQGEADLLAVQILSRLSGALLCRGDILLAAWSHLRGLRLARRYAPTKELALAYANHNLLLARFWSYERAYPFAEQAMDIYRQLQDRLGQCNALYLRGYSAFMCTRYDQAIEDLEAALGQFETLGGSVWETVSARIILAFTECGAGFLREARLEAEALYAQAEGIGYHFLADHMLWVWVASSGGQVPEEVVERAVARAKGAAHSMWAYYCQGLWRLHNQRDFDGAIESFSKCLEHMDRTQIDLPPFLVGYAVALRTKATQIISSSRGELIAQAERALARAARTAQHLQVDLPAILREQALLASGKGKLRRALGLVERSLKLAALQGAHCEEAQSLYVRGALRLRMSIPGGDTDIAEAKRALAELGGEHALRLLMLGEGPC